MRLSLTSVDGAAVPWTLHVAYSCNLLAKPERLLSHVTWHRSKREDPLRAQPVAKVGLGVPTGREKLFLMELNLLRTVVQRRGFLNWAFLAQRPQLACDCWGRLLSTPSAVRRR